MSQQVYNSRGGHWAFSPVAFSVHAHCNDIYPTQRKQQRDNPRHPHWAPPPPSGQASILSQTQMSAVLSLFCLSAFGPVRPLWVGSLFRHDTDAMNHIPLVSDARPDIYFMSDEPREGLETSFLSSEYKKLRFPVISNWNAHERITIAALVNSFMLGESSYYIFHMRGLHFPWPAKNFHPTQCCVLSYTVQLISESL